MDISFVKFKLILLEHCFEKNPLPEVRLNLTLVFLVELLHKVLPVGVQLWIEQILDGIGHSQPNNTQ